MNSYANVLLSSLLAWVREAALWLWNVIYGGDGGLVVWVAENWLPLTIALCLGGMAVDAVIHLLRWRWDLVWTSYFRRIRRRREQPRRRPAGAIHAPVEAARNEPEPPAAPPAEEPVVRVAEQVRRPRSEQPKPEQQKPGGLGLVKDVAVRLLSSPMKDEELPVRYQTPSLPVDREQAYGKPYVPPRAARTETIPTEDEQA